MSMLLLHVISTIFQEADSAIQYITKCADSLHFDNTSVNGSA